ncbi:hypothetical protein [uncultured Litoreibacter sp.]|uniref:hypothetical protein n=1 Tax=uncultured Litoreibacter sp. TaxID=1392394 RepID=UPI0026238FBE|nr:hypothetical protein [uncultured Litoreibacter sp.]
MSVGSTNIWDRPDANPMLWLATGALAFLAHLALLQFGIATYQGQVSKAKEPVTETKIFASALQIEGAEPPPELTADPVATPLSDTVEPSLQSSPSLAPSLAPVAVETLAPQAVAPPTVAQATPIADTPPPPPQPGVAPVNAAPITPVTVTPDSAQPEETLQVATLEAQTVTGVELAPEPTPEPAPEPAPLPELANSLPPPVSPTTEPQAGVASANVAAQTTEQAQETYTAVLDFMRSFDGGPCFAALPVLAEDGAFRFETFAKNQADLDRFRKALEGKTGTLPGTVMKPVSDAQCQALPFVTAAARYPEFQLYLDLAQREIPSGDILSGKLGNTSGGFVSLLLIDDEGVVQDLGSFLKFRAGYAGFDIPMTLKGSPVKTQQLLMALSTRARLKTLKSLSGQPAKDFFQRLAIEILLQGGGEDVALVAFSVR